MSGDFLNDLSDDVRSAILMDSMKEEGALRDVRKAFASATKDTDAATLRKAIALIKQLEIAEEQSGQVKWFDPNGPYPITSLPKHEKFFSATADYSEVMFLAANRVGKSLAGSYALACHLTGIYPDWWTGRRFYDPIKAWACGPDARTVRDTVQKELIGDIGKWGTGLLPASSLGKAFALQGTTQAIDIIMVKHVSGGWSEMGFKNYQQDIKSFMGTSRHVILLDEEAPIEIANECNIRTATTDGLMLYTFTPLSGLTPLVVNFCKNADFLVGAKPIVAVDQTMEAGTEEGEQLVGADKNKAVIQAGWNDAPWLDEKTKARLLEDTPEHLRKARSEGIPAMGSGNVFSTPMESVVVAPFAIPDGWPRMYGMDVGWNRTAVVWGALDPATDTLYLYDEHYRGQEEPPMHAYAIRSRGEWITGVIDPASRGRSQTDGRQLRQMYRDLGLELFDAKNDVEAGISLMSTRLAAGKLKVFSTLINLQKEYMLYRRDKNGKIMKENDHALDAARYIVLNLQRMSSKGDFDMPGKSSYKRTSYNV